MTVRPIHQNMVYQNQYKTRISVEKTQKKYRLAVLLGTVTFLLGAFHAEAQAGFEWTPPNNVAIQKEQKPALPEQLGKEDTVPAVPAPVVEKSATALTPEMSPEPSPVKPDSATGMKTISLLQKAEDKLMAEDLPKVQENKAVENKTPENDVIVMDTPAQPVQLQPQSQQVPTALTPEIATSAPAKEIITWNEGISKNPASGMAPVTAPVTAPHQDSVASSLVDGFGADIPLVLALRQIAPAQYAFQFQNKADAGVKISWEGNGRPWLDVLQESLRGHGLQAFVVDNRLLIAPTAAAALPLSSIAAEAQPVNVLPAESDQIMQPQQDEKPLVILSRKIQNWEARPGTTLRDVLTDWGQQGRYEIDWKTAYDYPIQNAFHFEGTVDQAIDAILSLYAQDHPKPHGKLYPNLPEGPAVLLVN